MNTPVYSGIITNYVCTASCRHCMFASSPRRPKEYLSGEMAERLAALLLESGADSVHIGGGEPFMNMEALTALLRALRDHHIGVDYIETNAFWCREEALVRERLRMIKALGVNTVMVSADPFHLEFVPLGHVTTLLRLLRELGFDYFVWKDRYLRKFRGLDPGRTYSRAELSERFGENYIAETAAEYGIGMNGRALHIAGEIYRKQPASVWLTYEPCMNLLDTCHCHLDLYGNIVPSGCPGLGMAAEDFLEEAVDGKRYPVFTRLYQGGTAELYEYAASKGFVPDEGGYPTRCAFCYAMRAYLAGLPEPSPDLAPLCFYQEMAREDH